MAAPMNKKSWGKKRQEYFCEVQFDGILQTSIQAKLLTELIKYIVYQCQQIPLPFDQIKSDVDKEKIQLSTPLNSSLLDGAKPKV